ncbi:MAG: porphobilinogen synthase [Alphaproteobacteria bacterium]
MNFIKPIIRPRRLRKNKEIRDLVQQNNIHKNDIVYPMFIVEGKNIKQAIKSMPDINRLSIDLTIKEIEKLFKKGIKGFALFPYNDISLKDEKGTQSTNSNNLINRAIREIKKQIPECVIFADVALDPYTTHGHDGVCDEKGNVLNDETVEILTKQSIELAKSEADFVCPSDMMDARIINIRNALDNNGFENTGIMSYAVKYASGFYGPFRDAVGSNNLLKGDKKTYQMNPANKKEALIEAKLDVQEGADIIMIKPGMPYLDIISQTKQEINNPVAVYQVSGEYSMLKNMIDSGDLSDDVIMESIICFKRAGADIIFTYFAPKIIDMID